MTLAKNTEGRVMVEKNSDPICDIRFAVANVLRAFNVQENHKLLVDSVVGELPGFFRNELQVVENSSRTTLIRELIDSARRVVEKHNEGTLAATPDDSRAITDLGRVLDKCV